MATTFLIVLAGIAYGIISMVSGYVVWEALFKRSVRRFPHLRAEIPAQVATTVHAAVSLYTGIVFAYIYTYVADFIPAEEMWKGAVLGFVLFMFFPLPMKIVSKMYHKEPVELLWPYVLNWLLTLVIGGFLIGVIL